MKKLGAAIVSFFMVIFFLGFLSCIFLLIMEGFNLLEVILGILSFVIAYLLMRLREKLLGKGE